MNAQRSFLFFALLFCSNVVYGQARFTQTIRGTVVDQSLQTPVPGATVALVSLSPIKGTLTESDGTFRLTQVPVGRHTLKISFVGYKDAVLTSVVVDAGKELVLTINLEEAINQLTEVTVKPTLEKDKPLNEMATVSARTFSVEETQRFAAAVNDPARMATAYAGVVGADDGNNLIVIRGNAPNGLLWRMEGVEIPNPNHFANIGSAAGGVSILSAQLLANSDFMTSAFPAEYGNALSGVFDLKLRRGNNQKRESTVQAGVLGIDVSSEGPFSKHYKGSYLFNYRYSTLGILSMVGVNVTSGVTTFQDLSFNMYLPTRKAGTFTLFGFGGLSSQHIEANRDSTTWTSEFDRLSETYYANTGAVGATHSLNIGRKAFLKTVVLASGYSNGLKGMYLTDELKPQRREDDSYTVQRRTISSVLTYKLNAKNTFRTGLIGAQIRYDLLNNAWIDTLQQIRTMVSINNQTAYTLQAYGQWNYRLSEQVTLNAGLHYLGFLLNSTHSVEPRASVRWAFLPKHTLSLGYGLHSQLQNPALYFIKLPAADGSLNAPNRHLGLSKSHHTVLAYDYSINDHLRLKAEAYYQALFNLPVSAGTRDAFSAVNQMYGFSARPLANTGKGRNYGAELTLEQFLHHNLYFLWSASLYRSEYQGSDQIWRSTRYDGNYATNLLAGKEFIMGETGVFKNSVLGLNVKLTYFGGYRDTPINLAESQRQQQTVYVDALTNTLKIPDYFRTDIRLSWKKNKQHSTRTLSLDIQNVTNRQNVFGQYFEPRSGTTKTYYMTGLLPILSYRIVF
nr:TonB-dependent receptor [uncultured Arsenicibacter sp.]